MIQGLQSCPVSAVAVIVTLEVRDVFQEEITTEDIVECDHIVRIVIQQLHHQEVSIVADGDGVTMIDEQFLLGQIGRILSLSQLLLCRLCPAAIDEGLAEYAEVFLCSDAVATNDITFCQAFHHPHITVLRGKDISHHCRTLCEGHIAQSPIELIHVDDSQTGCLRTDLLKCAQVVGGEVEQVFRQLTTLGIDEIIEELHLRRPAIRVLDDVEHLVIVAEMVFIINGEIFFQDKVRWLNASRLRCAKEQIKRV